MSGRSLDDRHYCPCIETEELALRARFMLYSMYQNGSIQIEAIWLFITNEKKIEKRDRRIMLACLAFFVHAVGSTGQVWRPSHSVSPGVASKHQPSSPDPVGEFGEVTI